MRVTIDSLRDALRASAYAYHPDRTAPKQGEWDRSQDEPRWRQEHQALVVKALHSWKGSPTDMGLAMGDQGTTQPNSGSGKILRAQAAALLWELKHRSKASRTPLYRGSHEAPRGFQPWTTSKALAEKWAGRNNGKVYELPGSTKGLRIADYLGSDVEREWIVSS